MEDAVEDPYPEYLDVEHFAVLRGFVQLWILHHFVRTARFVEETHRHRRQKREQDVVQGDRPTFEDDFAGPTGVDLVPEFDDIESDIFVEAVQDYFAYSENS